MHSPTVQNETFQLYKGQKQVKHKRGVALLRNSYAEHQSKWVSGTQPTTDLGRERTKLAQTLQKCT